MNLLPIRSFFGHMHLPGWDKVVSFREHLAGNEHFWAFIHLLAIIGMLIVFGFFASSPAY